MSTTVETPPLPKCLRAPEPGRPWRAPLDERDLTTRLETEGVTDAVATRFGFPSTLEMAAHYFPSLSQDDVTATASESQPQLWRAYWHGISFGIPLLLSSLAVLFLGFGLWGGDLSHEAATAVGLGTVASFLLTGGPIQSMARRGAFLLSTNQPHRAAADCRQWQRWALVILLFGAAASALSASLWNWLPGQWILLAAAFCLALGFFWITAAPLYILERGAWLSLVCAAGIGLVWLLHLALPLIPAQLIAIVACALASTFLSHREFSRLATGPAHTLSPRSFWQESLSLWPYFLFGSLYYLLVFGDRLLAWTTDTYATPLAIAFRGDYERAANLGLVVFVLSAGWVHAGLQDFYLTLARKEKAWTIAGLRDFRNAWAAYYWRRTAPFLALSLLAAAALWMLLNRFDAQIGLLSLAAMLGFPFLVWGLWNCSISFALHRAPEVVLAASFGVLAMFVSGYLASRAWGPAGAMWGFGLGALVFALASARSVLAALRDVDRFAFQD